MAQKPSKLIEMSKKILVVDDSAIILKLITVILGKSGYEVKHAIDGREALHQLDGRDFDLLITDLNMPYVDGISLTKEVRKMECYSSVPIVMLTSESRSSVKTQAVAAGVTSYIVKPFVVPTFLALIDQLLNG